MAVENPVKLEIIDKFFVESMKGMFAFVPTREVFQLRRIQLLISDVMQLLIKFQMLGIEYDRVILIGLRHCIRSFIIRLDRS